jgi:hypothetical protein
VCRKTGSLKLLLDPTNIGYSVPAYLLVFDLLGQVLSEFVRLQTNQSLNRHIIKHFINIIMNNIRELLSSSTYSQAYEKVNE